MKLPYTKLRVLKLKDLHPSGVTFRPIIELIVLHGTRSLRFAALLDTGADFNLFPLDMAEVLGINLSGMQAGETGGISGSLRTFYVPLRIKIEEGRHVHKMDTFAGFADVPMPLLGQNGFLDKINCVKFCYPDYFDISFRTQR